MYKMIVTDLDGTLLNKDRKVTNYAVEYLTHLKNKGYIICINSGRTLGLSKYATLNAEFASYIISDNGSCIYDLNNSKYIFESKLSNDLIKSIFLKYIDSYSDFEINTRDYAYRYSTNKIDNRYLFEVINNKEEFINKIDNVYNITFSLKDNNINVLDDLNKIEGINMFIMQDSFSNKKWVKIGNIGITKYSSLMILANKLKIDNQRIIAFGDGLNDIDMIKNVGLGVAIKNALPEIKEVAKDITLLDNNHDGVIEYLKNIIK